jgi:hypothetical protein
MKDESISPVNNSDDQSLRGYQDDLDTDESIVDDVTLEATDDPIKTFGVPAQEYTDELNKLAVNENDNDDTRESIEAADEGDRV